MLAVLHSGDTFSNGVIRGHSPYTYNIQLTTMKTKLIFSNYKYTSKQIELLIDSFLCVSMFVCIVAVWKHVVKNKIKIESRLHCIDIYDNRIIWAFIYLSMYLSIPVMPTPEPSRFRVKCKSILIPLNRLIEVEKNLLESDQKQQYWEFNKTNKN